MKLILSINILALMIVGIFIAINTPIVQISNSTGECVKVFSPHGEYDCDHLPTGAETEYVK